MNIEHTLLAKLPSAHGEVTRMHPGDGYAISAATQGVCTPFPCDAGPASMSAHPTGFDFAPLAALANPAALHALLAWTSPAYPTGAYSYSHGLEWAVEEGSVRDVAGVVEYVDAVLSRGSGWIDAVLFAHAHACAHDTAAFDAVAELAAAFRGSSEGALESHQQGAAFLSVTRRAWPHPALEDFFMRIGAYPVAHSIAMALACAAHGIACRLALPAWLHSTAANLVSAAVRLIPLGQTDGQIAIARLGPTIDRVACAAMQTPLDDLGTASPLLDICSIRHETQYTRLFRS